MSSISMHQDVSTDQREGGSRYALLFIFFCIACVTFLGVFLAAYVYWGVR
ncbi:MAG TPA: hypothetical protein VKN18_17305 [Blastocatellia bacterium]|nr:hypothetical protein [Blastocatellia bacterium]